MLTHSEGATLKHYATHYVTQREGVKETYLTYFRVPRSPTIPFWVKLSGAIGNILKLTAEHFTLPNRLVIPLDTCPCCNKVHIVFVHDLLITTSNKETFLQGRS